MKDVLLVLLIFPFCILSAQQEKPCEEYKQVGFTTYTPKTLPIFLGCESFKEKNDSLNICNRNFIASKIAEKMDSEFSPDAKHDDSREYYKVAVLMNISFQGKLALSIENRRENAFEDELELVLNEISTETTGIVPAKYENGTCSRFLYKLPISFDLTATKYEEFLKNLN